MALVEHSDINISQLPGTATEDVADPAQSGTHDCVPVAGDLHRPAWALALPADLAATKLRVDHALMDIEIVGAETYNVSSRIHNLRKPLENMWALRKAVPGAGLDRALSVAVPPAVNGATRAALVAYAAENPDPLVGSYAPPRLMNIDELKHLDILKLVYFYNDPDLRVAAPEHDLVHRKLALRRYLITF